MKTQPGKFILSAAIVVLLISATGAFLYFGKGTNEHESTPTSRGGEIWTCSMHPQVRLPNPGKCPICSMPLIRAAAPASAKTTNETSGSTLELSDHARAMASVETVFVQRRKMSRETRAVGKVQFNETGLANITARVEGYVERLFVDYTGVEVKLGNHLVEVYRPDLVVAQQENIYEYELPWVQFGQMVATNTGRAVPGLQNGTRANSRSAREHQARRRSICSRSAGDRRARQRRA